uniref:Uncharacterized protein n=1 Tax=Ciona intestinalis TaxID=7719 RepID=H2Y0N0_CIOIN
MVFLKKIKLKTSSPYEKLVKNSLHLLHDVVPVYLDPYFLKHYLFIIQTDTN